MPRLGTEEDVTPGDGAQGSFGGKGAVLYSTMVVLTSDIQWSGSRQKSDGHEFIERCFTHMRARVNEISKWGSLSLP